MFIRFGKATFNINQIETVTINKKIIEVTIIGGRVMEVSYPTKDEADKRYSEFTQDILTYSYDG